jgi:Circularly permutated YpsA SLOG family
LSAVRTRSTGGSPAFGPERQPPAELSADLGTDLRAGLRSGPGITILTGGQTGVDTLAAQAALEAGLPVHLVFPRGFRQEDGPLTSARRRALRGAALHELTSAEFGHRTWTCVGLADAVILIDPAGGEGCQETVRAAGRLGRPLLDLTARLEIPAPVSSPAPGTDVTAAVRDFIGHNKTQVLMIAGCRGSLLAGQNKTAQVEACVVAIAGVVRACQDRFPG